MEERAGATGSVRFPFRSDGPAIVSRFSFNCGLGDLAFGVYGFAAALNELAAFCFGAGVLNEGLAVAAGVLGSTCGVAALGFVAFDEDEDEDEGADGSTGGVLGVVVGVAFLGSGALRSTGTFLGVRSTLTRACDVGALVVSAVVRSSASRVVCKLVHSSAGSCAAPEGTSSSTGARLRRRVVTAISRRLDANFLSRLALCLASAAAGLRLDPFGASCLADTANNAEYVRAKRRRNKRA